LKVLVNLTASFPEPNVQFTTRVIESGGFRTFGDERFDIVVMDFFLTIL